MHISKYFIACLLMVFCLGQATAQKASKLAKKASDKVEQLNERIVAGDESVALSDIQKDMAEKLYLGFFTQQKELKKTHADDKTAYKAALKEARKAVNKTINKDVLTKEQRQAKNAGKDE